MRKHESDEFCGFAGWKVLQQLLKTWRMVWSVGVEVLGTWLATTQVFAFAVVLRFETKPQDILRCVVGL